MQILQGYFESKAEEVVVESVKRAKEITRADQVQEFDLAIDYLNNRMTSDVQAELTRRFPSSMGGDSGQQIYPVTMSLTERYVNESASLYNRPVTRVLKYPDGTTDAKTELATKQYNDALAEADHDEVMQENDRLTVLLGSSCVWHQFKRGKLKLSLVYPHDISAVCPQDMSGMDPSDPDDYAGFSIATYYANDDMTRAEKKSYCYVTPEWTVFYSGQEANQPYEFAKTFDNPYRWPRTTPGQEYERKPTIVDGPILPLSFWHRNKATKRLVCDAEPDIVYVNREINIAWSMIFDTMRFQGFATPVKKVANEKDPSATQRHGARFPVVLSAMTGEDFGYATANAPYSELVDVCLKFVKQFAQTKRMSPNDFAIDGVSPASGFAKLIDSLPKLEARTERKKRVKATDERTAYPRNASILIWAGKLIPEAKNMVCDTQFADIDFPRTVSEETQQIQFDLDHGLVTQAELLASRKGISVEKAEELLEERKGEEPENEKESENENEKDSEAESVEQKTEQPTPQDEALVLNGAQITSVVSVMEQVANKKLPRESAKNLLVAGFNLPETVVEKILGPVGKTFFVESGATSQIPGAAPQAKPQPKPEEKAEQPKTAESLIGQLIGRRKK